VAVVDPVGPVRTVDVPVPGDLPAVVVRGAREHTTTMLFIPGMCVHPGGYVMSFQHAAAARGDLVSVQGDVSCGGDGAMRRWSYDLDAMNRRIDAAFEAAGLGEPRDVVVIGYSQGAERAEKLVARWPAKYSRAILIASPVVPSAQLLSRAKRVALMAGTFDGSQASMRNAVSPLERAGVPAAYFPIPGARHGQMGETPEDTMRAALDFVDNAER
jgi:pimeloyl-ACP methyl ester carboxylesterase